MGMAKDFDILLTTLTTVQKIKRTKIHCFFYSNGFQFGSYLGDFVLVVQ